MPPTPKPQRGPAARTAATAVSSAPKPTAASAAPRHATQRRAVAAAAPPHRVLTADVLQHSMEFLSPGEHHAVRSVNRAWHTLVVPRYLRVSAAVTNAEEAAALRLPGRLPNGQYANYAVTLEGWHQRHLQRRTKGPKRPLGIWQLDPDVVTATEVQRMNAAGRAKSTVTVDMLRALAAPDRFITALTFRGGYTATTPEDWSAFFAARNLQELVLAERPPQPNAWFSGLRTLRRLELIEGCSVFACQLFGELARQTQIEEFLFPRSAPMGDYDGPPSPTLRILSCTPTPNEDWQTSSTMLWAFAAACPALEELHGAYDTAGTAPPAKLGALCPRLQTLSVYTRKHADVAGLAGRVLPMVPQLRTLRVTPECTQEINMAHLSGGGHAELTALYMPSLALQDREEAEQLGSLFPAVRRLVVRAPPRATERMRARGARTAREVLHEPATGGAKHILEPLEARGCRVELAAPTM